MEAVWYFLLALMFVVYVVLDGFDFGAGVLHLFVARTDAERRTVLAAIGPVWDGNEVWLLAGGGTLVFAFPRAYAVAFGGFYLALMLVLWLLVLRGVAIEFRSKLAEPLWRSFWDATLAFASVVMAIVLGVALGNLVRGVPIGPDGWFREDLFTNFRTAEPGAIDWYTGLVGVLALVALTSHGAAFLSWKTAGPVQERARKALPALLGATGALFACVTVATAFVLPGSLLRLGSRPWCGVLAALAVLGLVAAGLFARRGRHLEAFLASSSFFVCALVATAGMLYPTILSSTAGRRFDVTARNAATSRHALAIGLAWWLPALALAVGYFTYLFWSFRGKATVDEPPPKRPSLRVKPAPHPSWPRLRGANGRTHS